MALEDAPGTVELFGQDDTHERVGEGQRRERPALLGARQAGRRQAVGAADQQRDVAPAGAPGFERAGELLGGPGAATDVERNRQRARGQGLEQALAFECLRALGGTVRALAAAGRLDLGQGQRALVRQPPRVLGESLADPARHAPPDAQQVDAHLFSDRSAPRSNSFPSGSCERARGEPRLFLFSREIATGALRVMSKPSMVRASARLCRSVRAAAGRGPLPWMLVVAAALALGGCGGGANLRGDEIAADYDSAGPFPVPEEIRPNVDFWRHVYGVWGRGEVAFHDDEHLGVIYEVAELPGPVRAGYTREQKAWIVARKAWYRERLDALESKVRARAPLGADDRALLAKLEAGAGPGALEGAADRVRSQRGVRERFRRGLEISGRYDGEFREIMRARGVPQDLAFLPHVESSFQTHARSSVGAAGVWQFMPATGRDFGMRVDAAIDERLDPITCADSAARYLSSAHRMLGSWPLAITSYNHGPGGVANAKAQYGDDIGRIVRSYDGRHFGFASRNFYASFVAAREVARHPDRYFPEGVRYEAPWPHERLVLRSPMPVDHVARHYGVGTASLAGLNPHWREPVREGRAQLPGGSVVWLPAGSTQRVARHPPPDRAAVAVAARRSSEPPRVAGARSAVAAKAGAVKAPGASAGPESPPAPKYHVVKPNETLYRVAVSNDLSVEQLRRLNRLGPNDNTIRVGQKLRISG